MWKKRVRTNKKHIYTRVHIFVCVVSVVEPLQSISKAFWEPPQSISHPVRPRTNTVSGQFFTPFLLLLLVSFGFLLLQKSFDHSSSFSSCCRKIHVIQFFLITNSIHASCSSCAVCAWTFRRNFVEQLWSLLFHIRSKFVCKPFLIDWCTLSILFRCGFIVFYQSSPILFRLSLSTDRSISQCRQFNNNTDCQFMVSTNTLYRSEIYK